MKCVILEITKTHRTFDDSGWGHKCFTEYKFTLFADLDSILEIRSSTIVADTLSYFQKDCNIIIKGKYIILDNELLEYSFESNEFMTEVKYKTSQFDDNCESSVSQNNNISFTFRILPSVSDDSDELTVLFDSDCKNTVFEDLFIDNAWFY